MLRTLADALAHYGREAYLLTIAEDGPHVSNVVIELGDGLIRCAVGNSAAKNISRDSKVSLLWPSVEPNGYAMIVNGTGAAQMQPTGAPLLQITITKSVLHRPGPKQADSNSPCPSDCHRLSF
ncbi:MAG TPA: pyridoxamine 5'-phosphate oxidase family protein [Hyphomicrobiaceae bacterium]|nr:pyridoxamine 5'-phosphate oxidase family protein [Hyphomicrobiaceae bacterium]